MKALEEKIIREGKVLPGNILKVGSFLNQQLDCGFIMEMGKEIARLFSDRPITKILTIEASGIAIAVAAGAAMGIPAVFVKKSRSANISGAVYHTVIHSYTHGNDYDAVISHDYLSSEDRILIVDDFLASGEAVQGMVEICRQAGAVVEGISCAIEKAFQGGGDDLRKAGYKVESLAMIQSMEGNKISFRQD